MVLQKLITPVVLLAVLASTGLTDTGLCTVNCALAGLTRAQHEQMHHAEHEQMRDSAMSMTMPMASQGGQNQQTDMDMGTKSAGDGRIFGSRQCARYLDSVVLASASKFALTRTIDLSSYLVISVSDSGKPASVPNLSIARDSLPPPVAAQTPSAQIRI